MAAIADISNHTGALRVIETVDADARAIGLYAADPGFEDAIPPPDRGLAGSVRLALVELGAGAWSGPRAAPLLVVDGTVVRTLHRYGRANLELFGPGDLIAVQEPEAGIVSWEVPLAASLACLDQRFELAARRWPGLWPVALDRAAQRSERLAAHLAALQLSRVDARIEAVLWQLADRFGRVTTAGVVVPVPLTHEVLGRLTAAKRPTVSVALAELAAAGRVTRTVDGSWLLDSTAQPG